MLYQHSIINTHKMERKRRRESLGPGATLTLLAWCRGGQLGAIAMTVLRQPSGWRTRYTTDAVRDRDAARKHAGWGSARIHPSQGGPVAQARVFGLRHRGTSQGGGHMEDRRPLWFHAHGKPLRGARAPKTRPTHLGSRGRRPCPTTSTLARQRHLMHDGARPARGRGSRPRSTRRRCARAQRAPPMLPPPRRTSPTPPPRVPFPSWREIWR